MFSMTSMLLGDVGHISAMSGGLSVYKEEMEDMIRMLFFMQGDSINVAKIETTKISFSHFFFASLLSWRDENI